MSGMSFEEMIELPTANTYQFEQETQMRNRGTEDGMRQQPLSISDMSLEEMIYHFRQETQMRIRRMEDQTRLLEYTISIPDSTDQTRPLISRITQLTSQICEA